MTTRVELFNRVLLDFGFNRIDDPDSNEREAVVLRELYPRARDDVLMLRPWSCSIRRATIQEVATNSKLVPWAHTYQLPVQPKCRVVIGLLSKNVGPTGDYQEGEVEYVVENDKLLTDEPLVGVRYVAEIDIHEMAFHVASVLTAKLAVLAAVPLKESLSLQERKIVEFQQVYMDASLAEDRIMGPFGSGDNARSKIAGGTGDSRFHRR